MVSPGSKYATSTWSIDEVEVLGRHARKRHVLGEQLLQAGCDRRRCHAVFSAVANLHRRAAPTAVGLASGQRADSVHGRPSRPVNVHEQPLPTGGAGCTPARRARRDPPAPSRFFRRMVRHRCVPVRGDARVPVSRRVHQAHARRRDHRAIRRHPEDRLAAGRRRFRSPGRRRRSGAGGPGSVRAVLRAHDGRRRSAAPVRRARSSNNSTGDAPASRKN